jgi:hypothetical protein
MIKKLNDMQSFVNKFPDKVNATAEQRKAKSEDIDTLKNAELPNEDFFKRYEFLKPYTLKKHIDYKFYNPATWFKKFAVYRKQHIICLVHLWLKNNKTREFLAYEDTDGFFYRKGKYLFDRQIGRDNVDFGMKEYFFHEDFCLPFDINIPIDDVKAAMKRLQEPRYNGDIEYATNPKLLREWLTSSIIEAILKGNDIMKKVTLIMIIVIVIGIISLIGHGLTGFFAYKGYKISQLSADALNNFFELVTKK